MIRLAAQENVIWRRAGALILACVVLAAMTTSASLHAQLMRVLESTRDVMVAEPVIGALLFVLLCALSAMFAFVSAALMVPVVFYLWGLPITVALMWAGWVVGGACAYALARWLGHGVIRWLALQTALGRLERYVSRDTPFYLILLFQLALPSEIPGYVLGLVRYSFPGYLLALMIAELPFAAATVLLGANFIERRGAAIMIIGAGLVALSLGLFYLLKRQLARAN